MKQECGQSALSQHLGKVRARGREASNVGTLSIDGLDLFDGKSPGAVLALVY